ncbi:helix-turn-helix transcriptional regulator [Paenibacillus sp. J23TS9]|uniref:helix-turn-helix transcriptional regulator n=1 Tax=Paenibacillus sp. J23TS9 TaxID=2807193 RepID=UPI001BD029A9|nr:helix-turn-helix transcriptional regulator [Paenibacillus sp. J23TS9]
MNQVKMARIQADFTQQQLADRTGVTRQTISLIEKGTYNPSLKLCLEICYTLNRTLNDLFWVQSEDANHEKIADGKIE